MKLLIQIILILLTVSVFSEEQAGEVKVVSPFKPKAIGLIPEGWEVVPKEEVEAKKKVVVLKSGEKVSLHLKPFELRPKADAKRVFAVRDPGYLLAGQQDGQASATLEGLLRQQQEALSRNEEGLTEALTRLDALLKTLPLSEPLGN